jgi:diguanylate cyclase (GGDEF)-like protein
LYSALIQTRADVERAVAAVERREYHNTKDFHQTIRYLEKTANTDKLTGLSNRGQLNQYLDTYMQKALQAETDLTCLMIDMDNFKEINDSYGHGVGDTLLVFLGDLLRAFSREEDLAIRYGGDEFVLLLQDCSFEDARAVAERICKLFAKESVHCLPVNKNYSGQVHQNQMDTLSGPDNMIPYLSIGLASVRNNHCQDPQQLLELADKALYQAKQKGRNCVVVSNGGD